MKQYGELIVSFMRIGALTFGGGYAMLPMLQKELVERRGWVTKEEIIDYYAISQCLNGYIAINLSLFVGHKIKGRRGGLCAALGMVFPSLAIITIVAAFLRTAFDYPLVQKAFFGVRVVVCALILDAVIGLWKPAVKDWFTLVLYIAALALALFTPLPKVLLIVLAVVAGILGGLRRVEAEL